MTTEPARVPYGGVATRAVALAVDAGLAQVIVFGLGAVVALVASLAGGLHLGTVAKLLAAAAWLLIVAGYFVFFWTTTGQTPGMRLMGLRVAGPDGVSLGPKRAVVRVVGLGLAIVPFFAGFLPIFVDSRRRTLPDFMARTVVVYDHGPTPTLEEETTYDPVGVGARGSAARTAP